MTAPEHEPTDDDVLDAKDSVASEDVYPDEEQEEPRG